MYVALCREEKGKTLTGATALDELVHGQCVHCVAQRLKGTRGPRRALRENDIFPKHDRVASKVHRLFLGDRDELETIG